MIMMNCLLIWIVVGVLVVVSLLVMVLQFFKVDYQVSYMGMQVNGIMILVSEGVNKWCYSLNVKNQLVDFSQSMVFEEVVGCLCLLSSYDCLILLVKKCNVDVVYNWISNQVIWIGDIKFECCGLVVFKVGDMDVLLINLVIVCDLVVGKLLNYCMVDEGWIKLMIYKVVGQEKIIVEGRIYDVIKVLCGDGNKELIVWIVKEFLVLVCLLQCEGGKDVLDLIIKFFK